MGVEGLKFAGHMASLRGDPARLLCCTSAVEQTCRDARQAISTCGGCCWPSCCLGHVVLLGLSGGWGGQVQHESL